MDHRKVLPISAVKITMLGLVQRELRADFSGLEKILAQQLLPS